MIRAREDSKGIEIIDVASQGPSSIKSNSVTYGGDQSLNFRSKESPGRGGR